LDYKITLTKVIGLMDKKTNFKELNNLLSHETINNNTLGTHVGIDYNTLRQTSAVNNDIAESIVLAREWVMSKSPTFQTVWKSVHSKGKKGGLIG